MIAHKEGNQQLVLVAVAFGKATTNLFVIFDERGQIINVDISRDFVRPTADLFRKSGLTSRPILRSPMGVAAVLDWMVQDGERLANCRHDHPFAVLGPQPSDQGWTVRMWMPEAQTVTLLQAGDEIAMTTPNHP